MIRVRAAAETAPGLAPVGAYGGGTGRLVHPIVIGGVNQQQGEIERPPLDVAGRANPAPGFAKIIGTIHGRVFRFHSCIHDAGTCRRNSQGDSSQLPLGQPARDLAPGLSAVGRLVQPTTGPARLEEIRPATELPHAGIQVAGLLRVHSQVAATGVLVHEQDSLPVLAAIGGLVDASLVVGVPKMARDADIEGIAVVRVDQDLGHALGVFEAHVLPVLAAVGGLVDARSDGHAVARPGLAGADPDHFGVPAIYSDRADRLGVFVEDRFESGSAVFRFPDATAGGADIDGQATVPGDGVEGADSSSHNRRPDRPRFHSAERGRRHLRLGLGTSGQRKKRQGAQPEPAETQGPSPTHRVPINPGLSHRLYLPLWTWRSSLPS